MSLPLSVAARFVGLESRTYNEFKDRQGATQPGGTTVTANFWADVDGGTMIAAKLPRQSVERFPKLDFGTSVQVELDVNARDNRVTYAVRTVQAVNGHKAA